MAIRRISIVSCDICKANIESGEAYIDATYYGYTFHPDCWEKINGPTVVNHLGINNDLSVNRVNEGV